MAGRRGGFLPSGRELGDPLADPAVTRVRVGALVPEQAHAELPRKPRKIDHRELLPGAAQQPPRHQGHEVAARDDLLGCRRHPAVGGNQQRIAKGLPETVQLRAHRRLAETQPRRRPRHVSLGEQRLKRHQQVQIEAVGIYAHPEPTSLTRQLVQVTFETLERQGHEVIGSDLYGMRWKAVLDENDFPSRADPRSLSLIAESAHAYATGQQTADVAAEQDKLLRADAVIFQFPLWWFGVPAILKGWFERVYAYGFGYGYRNEGNRYRYGDGILCGKRALVSVLVGGPAADYGPRGINGPLDQLLFPLTHGALFFPGMQVLPTHAVYGTDHLSAARVEAVKLSWRGRVARLFEEAPIPYRPQNGGDYPDGHTLRDDVAPGQEGLRAHVAEKAGR